MENKMILIFSIISIVFNASCTSLKKAENFRLEYRFTPGHAFIGRLLPMKITIENYDSMKYRITAKKGFKNPTNFIGFISMDSLDTIISVFQNININNSNNIKNKYNNLNQILDEAAKSKDAIDVSENFILIESSTLKKVTYQKKGYVPNLQDPCDSLDLFIWNIINLSDKYLSYQESDIMNYDTINNNIQMHKSAKFIDTVLSVRKNINIYDYVVNIPNNCTEMVLFDLEKSDKILYDNSRLLLKKTDNIYTITDKFLHQNGIRLSQNKNYLCYESSFDKKIYVYDVKNDISIPSLPISIIGSYVITDYGQIVFDYNGEIYIWTYK